MSDYGKFFQIRVSYIAPLFISRFHILKHYVLFISRFAGSYILWMSRMLKCERGGRGGGALMLNRENGSNNFIPCIIVLFFFLGGEV